MFVKDLDVLRGDSFAVTFRFFSDGVPEDLSAWTFSSQIRATVDDEEVLAEFTVDASQQADGYVTLRLDPTSTRDLRSGVYDLQGDRAGEVVTRGGGKITVKKDVTR